MNLKLSIVLLVILCGLVAVVLIADRPPEEVKEEGLLFAGYVASDVTGVTWTANGKTTTVARVPGESDRWTVSIAGVDVPADADEIGEVLAELGRCNVLRRIEGSKVDAQSREDYGLTPEVRKVGVTLRGKAIDVVLGLKGVMRDTVYARRANEEDVLLVDDGLTDATADRAPDKVRAKRVLDWSVTELTKFSVTKGETGEVAFAGERGAEDRTIWSATVPYKAFLDPIRLERDFLPAIVQMEATEFTADGVKDSDLPKYGLDKPRLTIALEKREGAKTVERRLLVGAGVPEKEGMAYCMEAGRPFVLSCAVKKIEEWLAADPMSWRDRNLARIGDSPMGRIVAKWGDVAFEIEHDSGEYNLTSPEKLVLDDRAMREWFEALRVIDADAFIDAPDLAALGIAEPKGELTLYPPKRKIEDDKPAEWGAPALVLLIGNDRDDAPGVYVKRGGTDTVFKVGPALLDLLRQGYWRFKKKEVLAVEMGAKDVTRIRRLKGAEDENLVKQAGSWPEGIRGLAVTLVAKEVLDLTAVRWVGKAEGREEEYGFTGADRFEVRIALKDKDGPDEKEYGVVVGKETDGGRFARAIREGKEEPDVFVLAADSVTGLATALREEKKPEAPKEGEGTPETPKGPGEGPPDAPKEPGAGAEEGN